MRSRFGIRRRGASRGIALIEVLVTLTIVVMIGALSFATFGKRGPALVRAEAAEVALVLQRARMEAAERGQPVEIRWQADTRTLVAGSGRHQLRTGVEGPSDPLQVTLQPTGQSEGLILPVTADGFRVEITLDWLTGKVRSAS